MEKPESPHDWVADDVLHSPNSEHLDLCLVEVCHSLEDLHELKPSSLDLICIEPILWNVPTDVNQKAVLEQEGHEQWGKDNLHLVDDTLLNVLEGALKRDAF